MQPRRDRCQFLCATTHFKIKLSEFHVRSKRLHEIAEALGVPVMALQRLKETKLLHTDADGARWLLLLDPHGCPVVLYIGGGLGQGMTEENVSSFLRRVEENPQYEALTDLINQLLLL